jgi:hypothetical protein
MIQAEDRYIRTSVITATPMSWGEFEYITTDLDDKSIDRPSSDLGYYINKGSGGVWISFEEFNSKYRGNHRLNFGDALHFLNRGHKLTRMGWNGKEMFIFLVQGSNFKVNRPPLLGIYEEGTEIEYQPHIDMRTVDGSIVPWLASQTDIMAEDYYIIN